MPLVPAKCPNCGGVLDIDPSKEAAICSHCGTPFITEKAINNYKITNVANYNTVNNITGGEIHIHTAENDAPKRLLRNVFAGVKQDNVDVIISNEDKLETKYPESPEYLMAKVLDQVHYAFRNYDRDSVGFRHIENLITVKETAPELFEEYYPFIKKTINDAISEANGKEYTGDLPVLKCFFKGAKEEKIEQYFRWLEGQLKNRNNWSSKTDLKIDVATITAGDIGEDNEYMSELALAVAKVFIGNSFDLDGKAQEICDSIIKGNVGEERIAEFKAEAARKAQEEKRRKEVDDFFKEYLTVLGKDKGKAKKMLDKASGFAVEFEKAKFIRTLFGWKYTGSCPYYRDKFVEASLKEENENKNK